MISPLRTMAGALEDTALEALAPKGLIRRAAADVAANKARILAETQDAAEVEIDGETVRMSTAGPRHAACTCPAPGVCRHRLGAFILLRDSSGATSATTGADNTLSVDWSVLAAGFTAERLARFAGKAGWRAALAALDKAQAAEVVPLAGTLQVRLGLGEEPVIFLADADLESALTKAPEKIRKTHVALAALAVRHALGLPALEVVPPSPAPPDSPVASINAESLAAVRDLLGRLYRAGLAFAPVALEGELRRQAVAGRVEALPRLAGLLRAMAGGVAAIRRREIDADPERLLTLIAETAALIVALEHATPETRNALAGVARQDYVPLGAVSLYGIGARAWETASGAHGLTAYFHQPAGGRQFRLTQARPDRADFSFTAEGAFDGTPVWGSSIRSLSAGAVDLSNALASTSGRLSTAQATRAKTSAWLPSLEAIRDWSCAAEDWTVLEERLRSAFSPALAAPRIDDTPVILLHSRFAPLRFDELTQSLIWPLADRAGRWIGLTLAYQGVERARIETLERLAKSEPFWAVLALAEPVADRIELRPYALWGKTQRLLDFPPLNDRRKPVAGALNLMDRLKRLRASKQEGPGGFVPALCATDHAIEDAWSFLMRRAELGRAQSADIGMAEALAERFDRIGLSPLARQFQRIAQGDPMNDAALAAAWAIVSTRRSRMSLPWMN